MRRTAEAVVCLIAFLVCLAVVSAGSATAASPGEVGSFEIARPCYPGGFGPAPGAGVLVRSCDNRGDENEQLGASLAHYGPEGAVGTIAVPEAAWGPIVAGPGGVLWLGANPPEFSVGAAFVQRVDPDGKVMSWQVPATPKVPFPNFQNGLYSKVLGLTLDGEGAAWAAIGEGVSLSAPLGGSVGGELDRIDPAGTLTRHPLPAGIEPRAIALGPDGNLWFTAIRGRTREMHYSRPGFGFVGRITPAGVLKLFPLPRGGSVPTAIAAGPDGALWFVESEGKRIGTIGTDGRLGRAKPLWWWPEEGLSFGPEGDAWIPSSKGLIRMTPAGQQTLFPAPSEAVATGAEGDIWALEYKTLQRVVPGAPGIDLSAVVVRRRSHTIRVRLACGGSAAGCDGTLALSLPSYRRHGGSKIAYERWPGYRFTQVPYSIPAESWRTLTVKAPAKAFTVAARNKSLGLHPTVKVVATVAGGPTLRRKVSVPSLVAPAS